MCCWSCARPASSATRPPTPNWPSWNAAHGRSSPSRAIRTTPPRACGTTASSSRRRPATFWALSWRSPPPSRRRPAARTSTACEHSMIKKLLVANRGEIACRIMATCRRMGIRTVAVYSDADRDALHVATADEAVRIGPAEASGSYLNVDAILDAAKQTGADAIHPGYGFLSERVALAEGCAAAGIVWVGPNPDAITRMGSKIESKRIAEAADVPCVPGYHGNAQDDAALQAAAQKIGYPVLIKASAGGGGRGMRAVEKPEDLAPALALARADRKSVV